MKNFLECVDALEPAARAKVRAALAPDDVRMVHDASPLAWLPVELNLRATEATWRALGPGAREAFFAALGDQDFDSTLLKSTVTTAIRLCGVDPSRLMRWVPRGWSQVFRDDARIAVVDVSANELRIVFDDLPAALARSRAWTESCAASMTAFYRATRRQGTVSVEAEPDARRMVLVFRWT